MCEIKQVSHKILFHWNFCKKYDEQCFHFFQTILLVPQKWCFCDDFSSGTKDFVWNLLYCINILKNMQRSDPRIPSSGRAVFPPDPWIILIFRGRARGFHARVCGFHKEKAENVLKCVKKLQWSHSSVVQLVNMSYSHLQCAI